ncbi:MAG: FAD-dependent oxidoreductase [Cyclobacteriaceae bacterium]|nr:FAD-dependent oxidoreductase [Cyclobacteriaceae bacterium]
MAQVIIIGGGIVGLSSALYLRKAGYSVRVLDQGNLEEGCSFGNAGMIVPSHFIPLAAPGMVAKGIRWMFNSESPFYVRPRLSADLIGWGWKFYRHANSRHVDKSMPALTALNLYSKKQYQEWAATLPFDFGFQERGLLMLYHDPHLEKEEQETAELAEKMGIEARVLSLPQIQALEPDVRVSARGGVYYPGDAHLTPGTLMKNLLQHLRDSGVSIEGNTHVHSFDGDGHTIKSVRTTRGVFTADHWVVAAGSWSGWLATALGVTLPMQAGKGYSFLLKDVPRNTRIPTIFLEARVAVTPMGPNLRFGGTMEISGINHTINMNRVRGIVNSISRYYPDMKVEMPSPRDVWHGLRPCSPDGLPYIGRLKRRDNVIIASGHAMMGLSLGPGTGRLVSDLVEGKEPEVDLAPFDPNRYS